MDWLMELYNEYLALTKSNVVIAGMVSLWGMAMITLLLWKIPLRILGFCKRQFTTTLTLNNQSTGTNLETFSNFLKWFEKSPWSKWSRSMSLNGNYYHNDSAEEGTVVGMGNGSHFFIYKGRPVWLTRSQLQSTGTYQLWFEITVTMFGRNRRLIEEMIAEFKYKPSPDKVGIYQLADQGWNRMTDIPRRNISTVIMNKDLKAKILHDIEEFRGSREWYEQRGLPYKLSLMLHGIPGTGKSSLIKALASHFNMNLCVMQINMMTDNSIERALTTVPANSIVVIEDFDSVSASQARAGMAGKPLSEQARQLQKPVNPDGSPTPATTVTTKVDLFGALTLSGLLNALDGVVSLDGTIVILTTNVADTLDPALVRAGRIDHSIELGMLTHNEIRDYIELMFPDSGRHIPVMAHFLDIVGCDLQKLYLAHRHDVKEFINSIPVRPVEVVWNTNVQSLSLPRTHHDFTLDDLIAQDPVAVQQ